MIHIKFIMETKQCVICGFRKKVELHHLQKYSEYGMDTDDNLVYLCPNHHWIMDFGDDEDKKILLRKIYELTRQEPVIDFKKRDYYEKLIKTHIQFQFGEMSDEMYNREFLYSWNHDYDRRVLLSRPGSVEYTFKERFLARLELIHIKTLIDKKLKEISKNG